MGRNAGLSEAGDLLEFVHGQLRPLEKGRRCATASDPRAPAGISGSGRPRSGSVTRIPRGGERDVFGLLRRYGECTPGAAKPLRGRRGPIHTPHSLAVQYKNDRGDGREYGPASLEELRTWCEEGRLPMRRRCGGAMKAGGSRPTTGMNCGGICLRCREVPPLESIELPEIPPELTAPAGFWIRGPPILWTCWCFRA